MIKQVFTNTLYTNDNLFILNGLNSNLVDLIYLDPPFNSKRVYSAPIGSKAAGTSFKDMWTWEDVNEAYLNTLAKNYPALTKFIASAGIIHSKAMSAYLTYMAQRIIEMHRILKNTGSLYLHCDPNASHYLKVVLDEIFGKNNFVSEIIWSYAWGVRTAKRWNKKHDIILMYAKSANFTFNSNEVLEERKASEATQNRLKYKGAMITDWNKGRGTETLALPADVWYIPTINAMSKERTGYPTQKPLALLHRIIKASSNKGDIVMDPFCGCATTCVAAQQLERKWIGIDIEKQAVNILIERLSDDAGLFKNFVNTTIIPQRTDIQIEPPTQPIKEQLYKEQKCLCNACGTEFDIRNLEIDHIIPKAKGGGDYYENYQLLCGSCNRIKGDRPMEYLRLKIKTREEAMENKIIFGI
ncbi:MAG: HNH endonuclease [Prevotellaceae bacterium]|jgi:site-specific DNA-methyltransferase (adenine-specific)|nr:HNH endonuclease [Prevotellaceae bacterium]